MQGSYDASRARTECGLTVEVLHPGTWNQLGGPDFKQARLRFNGAPATGDIELHLHARDWHHHGHDQDPSYDQVILHGVLWSEKTSPALTAGGRRIPVLVLLPLLFYSLEEYAADAAVERLANRCSTRLFDELAALPRAERLDRLRHHARRRWQEKVRNFRRRCVHLGWTEACHQSALEILGYRFNRAAMLRIACRWPLPDWRSPTPPVQAAHAAEADRWSPQGVRPANRPIIRLQQYASWVRLQPDWPTFWQDIAAWHGLWSQRPTTPSDVLALGSRQRRLEGNWSGARLRIATEWCGNAFRGPRLDTLICNLLLPAISQFHDETETFLRWFHWYAGDLPPHVVRTLRDLDLLSYHTPLCHGLAEGLLGGWIEQERTLAAVTRSV